MRCWMENRPFYGCLGWWQASLRRLRFGPPHTRNSASSFAVVSRGWACHGFDSRLGPYALVAPHGISWCIGISRHCASSDGGRWIRLWNIMWKLSRVTCHGRNLRTTSILSSSRLRNSHCNSGSIRLLVPGIPCLVVPSNGGHWACWPLGGVVCRMGA